MSFTLYRMYGVMRNLLYVGRSINPGCRLQDHARGQDWWEDVCAIQLEHFDSSDELADAELEAIRTEHPIYNVVGDSLRKRITEIARQIDEVNGKPRGTALKTIYWIYEPAELCTPDQFEMVYAIAVRDLKVARKVKAGMSIDEAWELIEMPS